MATWNDRAQELSPVVRRLGNSVLLTDVEVQQLEEMQGNRVRVDAGTDFVTEGDPFTTSFVLRKGWAVRYRMSVEGKRQILSIVLPGDFVGLHVNYERHAAYSVQTVGEAELALIEPIRLLDLYRNFPVLASGLDWLTVTTLNIVAEHVVSIGIRSARDRILHLLLELQCRLMAVGEADEDGFDGPISQIHIADSLGLTTVYVSRCLKQLRLEGMVEMKRGRIRFPDLARTLSVSSFDDGFIEQFRLQGRLTNSAGRVIGEPVRP